MQRRALRWFPTVWAAGVYLVLLRLPVYSGAWDTLNADGSGSRGTRHATLAAVNGPRVYLLMSVPVLAAALAVLPWPDGLRRAVAIVGAAIAGGFVVMSLPSIGLFFLPSAVALIALAVADPPSSRPAA